MYSSVILNNSSKRSLTGSRVKNQPIPQNQPLDIYLRKKSQEYYYKLAGQQLSQQQMQIQFSKDILTHFLTNLSEKNMNQTYIMQTQENIRQNMVFLKTMYPQPKNSLLNRHIFEGLKQVDHSQKVQFDLLANLDMKFQYTGANNPNSKERDGCRMQILSQIQKFFNQLIKCSQKSLKQFSSLLTEQIPKKLPAQSRNRYQSLLKQPWKFDLQNDITKTHLYNKDLVSERLFFSSIQLFKVIQGWVQKLEEILVSPEGYFQKVDILKMNNNGKFNQGRLRQIRNHANKIFNKFQTNDSGSSVDQDNPQVKAKSQQETMASNQDQQWFFVRIFNKVRKMCNGEQDTLQPFQKIQTRPSYQPLQQSTHNYTTQPSIQNTQSYTNFPFHTSGYPQAHYPQSLHELSHQINYPKFCEQQLQFLYKAYIQTIRVVDKNKNKQKYTIEEKKVYGFCSNLYYFMEEIVIERLVKLISAFIVLREKGDREYCKWAVFRDVELVKFCEKSVVSAFIVADQKILVDVYNAIVELTKTRQAKIACIQNRFGTAHNDSTITLKIKNNPILCKLRLCIDQPRTGPQSKQKALSQLHQFLSKIQAFPYGPISYLSLILATKDHKINYLNQIRKSRLEGNVRLADVCHCGKGNVSERNSVNTFEKEIRNIIGDDGAVRLDCYRGLVPSSFVCGVCEKVIKKGETVIPVPCCTQCGFHICIQCSFENNPKLQVQTYTCLINQVAKIVDPCYHSELQLTDENKKNYNHSYTKDVQILSNLKPQVKKQIHYNIMLQGHGFVRYRKSMKEGEFWESVKEKINLNNMDQYREVIKIDKFIGIVFRPRQLLREKGQPFTFISYDTTANKFHKFVYKNNQQKIQEVAVTTKELNVSQNDAFIPILWIFGESLVTQYITKVLQTNPFYVKRMPMRDLSMDHMRFSRSKISSHHIMR